MCHIAFGERRDSGHKAQRQTDRSESPGGGDKPEQLTSWLDLYVNAREFIISRFGPRGHRY